LDDVLTTLAQAIEWAQTEQKGAQQELTDIEGVISEKLGDRWKDLRVLVSDEENGRRRALILLHAHFLRIPVHDSVLRTGERQALSALSLI